MRRAVAVYDISGCSGWAVYSPDLDEPRYGTLRLPPTMTTGSVGPAMHLLFDHIAWVDKQWPLRHLGFEAFLAPTGGKKDDDTSFQSSPKTLKKLIGGIAVLEMAGSMLNKASGPVDVHSIHNMSWKSYWLGGRKRGTDRAEFKRLSVAKAKGLGWDVKTDDEADALGQLHFLLHKLEIRVPWGRNPSKELIRLGYENGLPIHV